MTRWLLRACLLLLVTTVSTCATLQQIASLRQVAFSLAGIQGARLAGVSLNRVRSYQDLSMIDVGRLGLAVARKDLPLEFQVNVEAENPAGNAATATLSGLSWALFLNDKETIKGALDSSYSLPPGEPVTIPLAMSLNLYEFFDGSAESMVNLAAQLVGLESDPTSIMLQAVPTVNTPLGPITYPGTITVVNQTVGDHGAP